MKIDQKYKYCPNCGEPTRHILRRGYYVASADMCICTECGRKEEVSIPNFMKL